MLYYNFGLARSLPGCAVLTTTTRIFANQTARAAATCRIGTPEFEAAMQSPRDGLLVIGGVEGERARGVAADVPATLLAAAGVDFVVVEADGSRMLPVKAPAPHEPRVPPETALLVAVAGIDALNAPIAEVAHRPERVSALTGLAGEERLDAGALARLLASPQGGLKDCPPSARAVVLLNKVETPEEREVARRVAREVLEYPGVERVLIGALQGHLPEVERARDARAWEVHSR